MKVALVHDQLQEFGGAERVLVALKEIYPNADVFTSFYNPETLGKHAKLFQDWNIKTCFAQDFPFAKKLHSPLRFMAPWYWESFNFNGYDLVISSSGTQMCKGIITRPETLHISYIHHPPRYLYYYETAIEWQKYVLIKIYGHLINHGLRMWDYLSSQRPNVLIANSIETQKRITKFYRRESTVIYPPVSIPEEVLEYAHVTPTGFEPVNKGKAKQSPEYYITVSRLARTKRIDHMIRASNKAGFRLKVVGSGRDYERLATLAGDTVEMLPNVTDTQLNELLANAKGFIFASVDEEFGIAPVEAMGHGVPVIAYASGGLKETVKDGINGKLYHTLSADAIIEAVEYIESQTAKQYKKLRETTRLEAEKYSFKVFKKAIIDCVKENTFIRT